MFCCGGRRHRPHQKPFAFARGQRIFCRLLTVLFTLSVDKRPSSRPASVVKPACHGRVVAHVFPLFFFLRGRGGMLMSACKYTVGRQSMLASCKPAVEMINIRTDPHRTPTEPHPPHVFSRSVCGPHFPPRQRKAAYNCFNPSALSQFVFFLKTFSLIKIVMVYYFHLYSDYLKFTSPRPSGATEPAN